MNQPTVNLRRYCTSGQHEAVDDGNGMLRQAGKKGAQRWICSACAAKVKAGQSPFDFSRKSNAGRKPKPNYDAPLRDDPGDEREYIRQVLGI